jgi:hypothetical protein
MFKLDAQALLGTFSFKRAIFSCIITSDVLDLCLVLLCKIFDQLNDLVNLVPLLSYERTPSNVGAIVYNKESEFGTAKTLCFDRTSVNKKNPLSWDRTHGSIFFHHRVCLYFVVWQFEQGLNVPVIFQP